MIKNNAETGKQSFSSFLLHIHPPTVPPETLRFTLSFGLGGMSLTLIVVLFLSGLLQLLSYSPEIQSAYPSIINMYTKGSLNGFIRNLHFWSGNLLVVMAFLHMLRVFLTGAINQKRRTNWIIGLLLFALILFANFTGYLLPWDQLAYWAVTIFTNMLGYFPVVGQHLVTMLRGGSEVGQNTLSNFFVLHVALIPGFLLFLIVWHIWLIRKAGGLIQRKHEENSTPRKRIATVPALISREAAVGLGLIALVGLFSVFVTAPLDVPANPAMSPNPAKGAWYFLGLQELLLHFHPQFAICILPLLALFLIFGVPFFKDCVLPGGIWFGGKRGKKLFFSMSLVGLVSTFSLVIIDDVMFRSQDLVHPTNPIYTRGIIPLCILIITGVLIYQLLRRRSMYKRSEIAMGLAGMGCASLVCLTVIGIWLRGPGMQLILPWGS